MNKYVNNVSCSADLVLLRLAEKMSLTLESFTYLDTQAINIFKIKEIVRRLL